MEQVCCVPLYSCGQENAHAFREKTAYSEHVQAISSISANIAMKAARRHDIYQLSSRPGAGGRRAGHWQVQLLGLKSLPPCIKPYPCAAAARILTPTTFRRKRRIHLGGMLVYLSHPQPPVTPAKEREWRRSNSHGPIHGGVQPETMLRFNVGGGGPTKSAAKPRFIPRYEPTWQTSAGGKGVVAGEGSRKTDLSGKLIFLLYLLPAPSPLHSDRTRPQAVPFAVPPLQKVHDGPPQGQGSRKRRDS